MITLRMEGFEKARAHMSGLSKQVAFAASKALNETARVYVNLMSANVRQRLEQLTGQRSVAYAPTRAVA